MNVTLGVPRYQGDHQRSQVINTPIIEAKLVAEKVGTRSTNRSRVRIEKTYLGDIASVIEEAWAAQYTYLGVHIDMEAIQKLQLEITLNDIKWAIVNAPKSRSRKSASGGAQEEPYPHLRSSRGP